MSTRLYRQQVQHHVGVRPAVAANLLALRRRLQNLAALLPGRRETLADRLKAALGL